jgi:hypothetical protein
LLTRKRGQMRLYRFVDEKEGNCRRERGEQLYRPSFAERGELHFGAPRLIEASGRT